MKGKTKTKHGEAVKWLAIVLAVLAAVGCFATLIPRKAEPPPVFETYGSDVDVVKINTLTDAIEGTITAASCANGMYFTAIETSGLTKLLVSNNGSSWTNVLDHPSTADLLPWDGIIDEIVYVNSTWFFGFQSFDTISDGMVFRFRPDSGDNSGLGGDWQASFDGRSYGSGRATAMDVIGGTLYLVTENGHLFRKTSGGAWYLVNESVPTPFAGYRVFDIAKCGDTYLALGEDASGSVLFTARAMTGTWTVQRLSTKANRFDTTDSACFIACDNGTFLYTEDFENWKTSRMPDNVSFTEFFVYGGNHYAVGINEEIGVVYESTNGGASWERVAETDEPLVAVSVGSNEALLYGEDGGIFRLTK